MLHSYYQSVTLFSAPDLPHRRKKRRRDDARGTRDAGFDFAISLGGTITGEHGVGLAKKPFLRRALGNASLDLMKLLKKSLDPLGILNPGKIFD